MAEAEALGVILPDLLLTHAKLDTDFMCSLALVCKDFREAVHVVWEQKRKTYEQTLDFQSPGQQVRRYNGSLGCCNGCGACTRLTFPFDPTLKACRDCTSYEGPAHLRTISFTACKEELLLTNRDLHPCPVLQAVHRTYHNEIRMYRWRDVLTAALVKYGGPAGLAAKLKARDLKRQGRGKPKEKRQEVAERIVTECDPQGRYSRAALLECCSEYVRNGSGGQKGAKACIERFINFEMVSPPCSGGLVAMLARSRLAYVRTGSESHLEAALRAGEACEALGEAIAFVKADDLWPYLMGMISLEELVMRARPPALRRQELINALASEGLVLRSSSRLCNDYIDSGVGDIDDIVWRCTSRTSRRPRTSSS